MAFLAVSKDQIEKPPEKGVRPPLLDVMNENLRALMNAREYGLFSNGNDGSGRGIPVFESGKDTATMVYFPETKNASKIINATTIDKTSAESLGVVQLVASIVNFFTAVKADIFVGVRGSSYSTDIFSARYYMNQDIGATENSGKNYIVGPKGIEELIGPPAPHHC